MGIKHICKENGADGRYLYKITHDKFDEEWYIEEDYYHSLIIDYCPFCGVKLDDS